MPGMTWKARTCSAVPVSYTALVIAQRDVQHTRCPRVQRPVGRRRLLEGELGRGEGGQREVGEEGADDPAAADDVPPGGQRGRDRGDLAAADRQAAPVEGTAERQLDRL